MAGAGSLAGGEGPAGEDDVAPPPDPRRVTLPAALLFDGKTKDYPLDGNGLYQASHPVDQRVALRLLVARGKIPSSPTTGASFAELNRLASAKRAMRAQQIVRTQLADMVAAGDIRIVAIRTDASNRYATLVEVDYLNLRLLGSTKRTAQTTVT